MKLPSYLTKVTPLSKTLALILFILLPFLGFYLGVKYQSSLVTQPLVNQKVTLSPEALKTLYIKSQPMIITPKNSTKPEDINQIVKQISQLKGITRVDYVSNEQAWEKYKEANKNDQLLIQMGNASLLPSQILVYLDYNLPDKDYLALEGSIKQQLKSNQNIISVISSPF